jgi:hypothetical protein
MHSSRFSGASSLSLSHQSHIEFSETTSSSSNLIFEFEWRSILANVKIKLTRISEYMCEDLFKTISNYPLKIAYNSISIF